MELVKFNIDKPTPEEIRNIYDKCKKGIEIYFDPNKNPSYYDDFAGLSEEEVIKLEKQTLDELSLRSSFYMLAYIETLFRTDFILRIESNKKGYKDVITKDFKKIYNPARKPYTYSLVDDIFKIWRLHISNKSNSKEMSDILNTLPQYFDFRNWMAHGRYWIYNESNYMKKYNFPQIEILLAHIEKYFDQYLKKKNFGILFSSSN